MEYSEPSSSYSVEVYSSFASPVETLMMGWKRRDYCYESGIVDYTARVVHSEIDCNYAVSRDLAAIYA